MPRWPHEIAEAVFFDIRYGLKFKVGAPSRPATDQEIEVVARTIVERLQHANWVVECWTNCSIGRHTERLWSEAEGLGPNERASR